MLRFDVFTLEKGREDSGSQKVKGLLDLSAQLEGQSAEKRREKRQSAGE